MLYPPELRERKPFVDVVMNARSSTHKATLVAHGGSKVFDHFDGRSIF
jgi:hypothetical protein